MKEPFTLEDGRELFTDPRVDGLLECLSGAEAAWKAKHHGPSIGPGTRGAIIADLFYFNVTTHPLLSQDHLELKTVKGQRLVVVEGKVSVRCKHVDGGLASKNYPTVQAQQLVEQEPLPGFPNVRLELGYWLDDIGLNLKDVFIIRPLGNRNQLGESNEWVWQIWGDSIETDSTYGLIRTFPDFGFQRGRFYYEDRSTKFA